MNQRDTVQLPLAGLRVIDSADVRGEMCGRILADLGADVIRIEPPDGAASRSFGPFHEGESLHFAVRNLNKRGATLDLGADDVQQRFESLLDGADAWVDAGSSGALARVGPDPEEVLSRHPRLVITSISDFGTTGPYCEHVATDAVMTGLSWMLYKAGITGLPPVLPPGNLAYDIAGITAAFATLVAVLHQRRTGNGQLVDLSVMESVAQTTDWGLANQDPDATHAEPTDIRSGSGALYPVIRCADGWVRPSVVTIAEWNKLRDWFGDPEELQDPRFDTPAGRAAEFETVLRPHYERHFRDLGMIEASEEGQRRRIPITPLLRPDNIRSAAQYVALGSFVDAEVAPGLVGPVASGPYIIGGERVGVRRPAPEPDATSLPAWGPRPVRRHDDVDDASPARRPFEGLRVLDFGVAGAAPEIARLLGEYGADVIRVESPHRPDLFRQLGGPSLMSAVFASSNRTKRSIGVDFEKPGATRLVLELVARADVVVENLPPGTMDRWGLGVEAMRSANPEVLVISSQTMGTTGPWRHWRGYGANTQPVGGMTYLWTHPDEEEPVGSNVAFPDHVVGRLGAVAAAAYALARHDGVTQGGHVEIVQAEVCLNLLADLFLADALTPGSVRPLGNRSDRGAPWGVYPCRGTERWCVITCRDDDDWRRMVEAMGRPDWALEPDLATATGRRRRHDWLDERIAGWTRAHSDVELMATLQNKAVPAGRMMYVSDQPGDPHLRARGFIRVADQPGLGRVLMDGPAFHCDLPDPVITPAPLLGEHTRAVARDVLDLTADETDRLVRSGVLHTDHNLLQGAATR